MDNKTDHAARVAEIQARLEAATPGPWRHGPDPGRDCSECGETHDSGFAIVGSGANGIPAVCTIETDARETGNRDLIAHAPADLRYLLARVRELEAALVDDAHTAQCVRVRIAENLGLDPPPPSDRDFMVKARQIRGDLASSSARVKELEAERDAAIARAEKAEAELSYHWKADTQAEIKKECRQ